MNKNLITQLSEHYDASLMEFMNEPLNDQIIEIIEKHFLANLSPILGEGKLIAYDGIYKYLVDDELIKINQTELGDFKNKDIYLTQLAKQIT